MKSFAWIYGINGLLLGGYYAIWQPQLLERGFTVELLGWLLAADLILSTLFDLPTGILADRIGHKRVATAGFFLYFLAFFPPSISASAYAIAITVLIVGLANACISGALDSWADLHNSTSNKRRLEHYYDRDQWLSKGKLAGALLIPGAVTLMGDSTKLAWAVFFTIAFALFLMAIKYPSKQSLPKLSSPFFGSLVSASVKNYSSTADDLKASIKDNALRIVLAIGFLAGIYDAVVGIALRPKFMELGLSTAFAFGILQFSITIARMLGISVYRRMKLSTENVLLISFLLNALAVFAFSQTQTLYVAGPVWLLQVAIISGSFPALKDLTLSTRFGSTRPASALSASSIMGSIGSLGAYVALSSILFSHLGTSGAFLLSVPILIGAAVATRFRKKPI
jgi:MFS family permease